ncbi:growth hormone secretagogue receptor type 1-like [Styela clava]|uniref:pyrokinin-1 receptor-like n=1 Tax=Styela clava TaxID=7725 RepID=UPI00193AB0A9|nr:pyrokinin-1 receptor-like [Styela clava]
MSGMEIEELILINESTHFINMTTMEMTSSSPRYISLMDQVFSMAQLVPILILFGVFMIFGMLANAVTFIVISNSKKTAFNVFIMSLCVSDFLSAVNSPLIVYRALKAFDDYRLPVFFCKLGLSIDYWTSISTIQHILIFSFLRLYCIKFPHKFNRITVNGSTISIVIIWFETFFVGFLVYMLWPDVQYLPDTIPPRFKCGMTRAWAPTMFQYAMIAFPIFIYAPMVLILLTCLAVAIVLLQRRRDKEIGGRVGSKKERFALLQLALIVISFLIGYSADASYRVTAISSIQRGKPISARTELIYSLISHCLLRLSECLNPIFYNFSSSELRSATKKYILQKFETISSSKIGPLDTTKKHQSSDTGTTSKRISSST